MQRPFFVLAFPTIEKQMAKNYLILTLASLSTNGNTF